MDVRLDPRVGKQFKSASQWARVTTEAWAERWMYCIACPSRRIQSHRTGMAVEDFHCKSCDRRTQLKAKSRTIGASVANSAYGVKMRAIQGNCAPDYLFMSYDRPSLQVLRAFVVPGHFMTASVVSPRPPLGPQARRAGWVGSNIHLSRIPEAAKVGVVLDGLPIDPYDARAKFASVAFVAERGAATRSWLGDVIDCIEGAGVVAGNVLTLHAAYGFEARLAKRHPDNLHIRPKIRQQLQILVANGYLERLAPGVYRKL